VALVQKFCEQGDLLKLLHKCGGRMNERASVQVGRPCVGGDKTLRVGAQGLPRLGWGQGVAPDAS
jgi:hypothetical protein